MKSEKYKIRNKKITWHDVGECKVFEYEKAFFEHSQETCAIIALNIVKPLSIQMSVLETTWHQISIGDLTREFYLGDIGSYDMRLIMKNTISLNLLEKIDKAMGVE